MKKAVAEMSDEVIIAIITGVFTLVGTIITVMVGMSKANKNIEIVQAVTNTKLDYLAEKVNNLERRIEAIDK